MRVTWIGHATFLIKTDKLTLLTDPWFGRSLFYRRLKPPAIETSKISSCDIMLVSHAHGDHFDRHGLDLADRLGSWVLGPPSVIKKVKKKNIRCKTAKRGEIINIPGVEVLVVSAYHPAPGAKDAVGYVFQLDGKKIYFAGDTLLFPELVDILKDPVDLAFLPIGPYILFGRKMGMNVSDVLTLINKTNPRAVIPMHYNCLKGTRADPDSLLNAGCGTTRIIVLSPGQTIDI